MSNKHSHSDLLAKAIARVRAKHNLPHASDEVELQCPQCGYQGSEDSFDEVEVPDDESDDDGEDGDGADNYKTDPSTSGAGNEDADNGREVDQVPQWNNMRPTDRLNYLAQSLTESSSKAAQK